MLVAMLVAMTVANIKSIAFMPGMSLQIKFTWLALIQWRVLYYEQLLSALECAFGFGIFMGGKIVRESLLKVIYTFRQ